jgi:hypothetical protein
MKTFLFGVVLAWFLAGCNLANAADPAAQLTERTYNYRWANQGQTFQQQVVCDYPTTRADGTALDWSTEGAEIKWYMLLNVGGPWETEVVYSAGPDCFFWMPLTGMPDFNLSATAVDSAGRESVQSPALEIRFQ